MGEDSYWEKLFFNSYSIYLENERLNFEVGSDGGELDLKLSYEDSKKEYDARAFFSIYILERFACELEDAKKLMEYKNIQNCPGLPADIRDHLKSIYSCLEDLINGKTFFG
ncbi:hypothetical protein J4455_03805 [Candidatus Woesearchaeota archaeon]|nr:hypothetical protein [Candidatus Woesearchaeota archaeon]